MKRQLFIKGVGSDEGQAGRYLSNISQFLTKKSNPHLRQVVEFDTGGALGEMKNNYRIVSEYRELLQRLIDEWLQANEELAEITEPLNMTNIADEHRAV